MHLIHVPIVASAVPPPLAAAVKGRGRCNALRNRRFMIPETIAGFKKTETISRPLPLFASHA
jgi:hypothetical protein